MVRSRTREQLKRTNGTTHGIKIRPGDATREKFRAPHIHAYIATFIDTSPTQRYRKPWNAVRGLRQSCIIDRCRTSVFSAGKLCVSSRAQRGVAYVQYESNGVLRIRAEPRSPAPDSLCTHLLAEEAKGSAMGGPPKTLRSLASNLSPRAVIPQAIRYATHPRNTGSAPRDAGQLFGTGNFAGFGSAAEAKS